MRRGRSQRRAKQLIVRDSARQPASAGEIYGTPSQIARVVQLLDDLPRGSQAAADVIGLDLTAPAAVGKRVTVSNPIGADYVTGDQLVVMWCEFSGQSGIWVPTCCGEGSTPGEEYPCTWCQEGTTPNFFDVTMAGVVTVEEQSPGFSFVPVVSQQEARDWLNQTRKVRRLGTSPCIFEVTEQLPTDNTDIKMRVELVQTGVQVRVDVINGPPDSWLGLAPDTSPYVGTGERVPALTGRSSIAINSYVSFDAVDTVTVNGTFA